MSRWTTGQAYIQTKHKSYEIWVGALNYCKDNGTMHYSKVEVYGHTQEEVERLQNELLGFLQAQEMCGVSHG